MSLDALWTGYIRHSEIEVRLASNALFQRLSETPCERREPGVWTFRTEQMQYSLTGGPTHVTYRLELSDYPVLRVMRSIARLHLRIDNLTVALDHYNTRLGQTPRTRPARCVTLDHHLILRTPTYFIIREEPHDTLNVPVQHDGWYWSNRPPVDIESTILYQANCGFVLQLELSLRQILRLWSEGQMHKWGGPCRKV
jgi:hypothetical protein